MKRILITLLAIILIVPLVLGGSILYSYYRTNDTIQESPILIIQETSLQPTGYEWHKPVWAGLLYRDFFRSITSADATPLTLSSATPNIIFPDGYDAFISITKDGVDVFNGSASDWPSASLLENGIYTLAVSATKEKEGNHAYGTFFFNTQLQLDVEPSLKTSHTTVLQGDVFAIELLNLQDDIEPMAQTEIGLVTFTPQGQGRATAYVPIAYHCEPGDYTVTIQAGSYDWEVPFTVQATEFTRQDMTIDTTDEIIGEANSPAAYQQYRDKIYPLFDTADPQQYWSGLFIRPTTGYISTEYGLRRYTNGETVPSRHSGLDIAAGEGTPIVAPNNGRVIFAEHLLNTGNTLVIEHGGGLKSYFFHMHDLQVAVGDLVQTGQPVGTVGTTGYSTGPHLHYEVRIGNQTISPALLFSGDSSLYFFDDRLGEQTS